MKYFNFNFSKYFNVIFLLLVILVYLIRINDVYDTFENVVKLFLINFSPNILKYCKYIELSNNEQK